MWQKTGVKAGKKFKFVKTEINYIFNLFKNGIILSVKNTERASNLASRVLFKSPKSSFASLIELRSKQGLEITIPVWTKKSIIGTARSGGCVDGVG